MNDSHQELVAELKRFVRTADEMRSYGEDGFTFNVNDELGYVSIEAMFDNPRPDDFTYLRRFATLFEYVTTESYSDCIVLEPLEQAQQDAERFRRTDSRNSPPTE